MDTVEIKKEDQAFAARQNQEALAVPELKEAEFTEEELFGSIDEEEGEALVPETQEPSGGLVETAAVPARRKSYLSSGMVSEESDFTDFQDLHLN